MPSKIDDSYDFGFTLVDEKDVVEPVQQATNEAEASKKKLDEILKLVSPLLKNLAKDPEKAYLHWPDRAVKMKEFIKRVEKVTGAPL